MKKISFEVGKDKIRGTLFYPKEAIDKYPAVLFIHGWTSTEKGYVEYSEALNKIGVACLTFDLRGHGNSDGNIKTQSRQDFLNDAVAAYDYLARSDHINRDDITVVGSSFGSYLATLLTPHRSIKRLILRVPANYPDSDLNEPQSKHSDQVELLKWRYEIKSPQDTSSLKALHNFGGDVLVVESQKDKIIPHQTIANYLQAVRDKDKLDYIIMKGAPHGLSTPSFRKEYLDIITSWISSKLQP